MKQLIACCGLDCENCDARIATINNDDKLREETRKPSIARVVVLRGQNSPIVAIIVKSGNVFKQRDSTPVAIVMN